MPDELLMHDQLCILLVHACSICLCWGVIPFVISNPGFALALIALQRGRWCFLISALSGWSKQVGNSGCCSVWLLCPVAYLLSTCCGVRCGRVPTVATRQVAHAVTRLNCAIVHPAPYKGHCFWVCLVFSALIVIDLQLL
jgi:hypothetical protein